MGVSSQESNKCTRNVWCLNSGENWLTEGYNWIDPMFWRRTLFIVSRLTRRPAVVSAAWHFHFFISFRSPSKSPCVPSHFILPSDYCGIFIFSRVHKELQEYLARKENEGPRWLTWNFIDRMQKWLPINYSFIFVLISLTSLVSMRKIQKNFHTKMRLVSLISIHIKE